MVHPGGSKVSDPSSCSVPSSQSVYDFSCKPISPPVPLHKTRKDSRSPRQAKDELKGAKECKESKPDSKTKTPEKKAINQTGLHSGYLNQAAEPVYETRVHNQQELNRVGAMKQSNVNYSQPATTYHPGPQHSLPRHSYMTPHYHYQGGVSTNQHSNSYHHSHPYSHPGPLPEMKGQVQTFQQEPKYSCASHAPYTAGTNLQDFQTRFIVQFLFKIFVIFIIFLVNVFPSD